MTPQYRIEFSSLCYIYIYRYNWLTRFFPSFHMPVTSGFITTQAADLIARLRDDYEIHTKKPIRGSLDVVITFLKEHIKDAS